MRNRYINEFSSDERNPEFDFAYKKVKRIKGFYVHCVVYVLVNIFLLVTIYFNLDKGEQFWKFENFSTLFFWGIGLLAHGLSVFGQDFFLGKNWEEKKIKSLMEKEKSQNWK